MGIEGGGDGGGKGGGVLKCLTSYSLRINTQLAPARTC